MSGFSFIDDLNIVSASDELEGLFEKPSLESLEAEESMLLKHLSEIRKRLKEVQDLKKSLEADESLSIKEIELGEPSITKEALIEEKAEFLLDLFKSRRDVYAVRSWNNEKKRASYYTKCYNAWSSNCPKKIHKQNERKGPYPGCSDCNVKKHVPLNKYSVIGGQLKNDNPFGIDAIGIYTLFDSDKCGFIAIDFDEKNWKEEVLAVANVFRSSGFQAAIEVSFSGNGAHLWIFFSESVLASKARKLAFRMLDNACSKYKNISFKSYDRIFPLQDRIDGDGLGNLILMPLVLGAARRKENKGTVFVDNSFKVYPDQIAFLSSLPRYTENDIDIYFEKTEEFNLSPFVFKEQDEIDVLQKNKLPRLNKKDLLVEALPLYLSAGISIPQCVMSPKMEDAFKRLSTFSNPEYFKMKRMNGGYISKDCSSLIPGFIESDSVLQLPRGLKNVLLKYLESCGISYELIDRRFSDKALDAEFLGVLRPEQEDAFNAMLNHETGIMRAATSFGKTVTAAALIVERKERALILVSSDLLMHQWEKSLKKFIRVHNQPIKRNGKRINKQGIGMYGGSRDSLSGYIDIAMLQSLAAREPEFIRGYGTVIVDECHHIAADTFVKVLQMIRAKYVYGLSATVKRSDGLEKIVYSQCGNVRYEYGAARLAAKRGIMQTCVPRFTSLLIPNIKTKLNNQVEILKAIALDSSRNELIAKDVLFLLRKKRKILILTKLLDHVDILNSELRKRGVSSVVLTGAMQKSEIKKSKSAISSYSDGYDVIISTGRYLGEGVDIPYLDTLMVVMPVSWEGILSQYAGRISREYEDKKDILIYDYVDVCVKSLALMYSKRLSVYKKLGFAINEELAPDNRNSGRFQYSGRSFFSECEILDPVLSALKSAEHRIIISSNMVLPSETTKQILNAMKDAKGSGIEIAIKTKACENKEIDNLNGKALSIIKDYGYEIEVTERNYLNYLVIDDSELWFGNISLLGNLSKGRCDEGRVMLHTFNKEAVDSIASVGLLLV